MRIPMVRAMQKPPARLDRKSCSTDNRLRTSTREMLGMTWMTPYLLGCLLLLGAWFVALVALRVEGDHRRLRAFWWSSCLTLLLGPFGAVLVPAVWWPASILAIGRWDLESFLVCFAAGGIASYMQRFVDSLQQLGWAMRRGRVRSGLVTTLIMKRSDMPQSSARWKSASIQAVGRSALVVVGIVMVAGRIVSADLGVIQRLSFVCMLAAISYARRSEGRWLALVLGAGGFLMLHALVAQAVLAIYPDFYWASWNFRQGSGRWWLGIPLDAHLLPMAFGMLWVPVWRDVESRLDRRSIRKPPGRTASGVGSKTSSSLARKGAGREPRVAAVAMPEPQLALPNHMDVPISVLPERKLDPVS